MTRSETAQSGSVSGKLREVLFLAYMFPPTGGGGVQRSLKFAKYLPTKGWKPHVLTVRPISYYVYDPKLLDEVPESVEVVRTGSLDPLRLSALLFNIRRPKGRSSPTTVFVEGSSWVKMYRRMRKLLFFPDAQAGWIPFAVAKGRAITRRSKIEVIYSPGAPYSSAIAAYLLSQLTGIPYIVDFRDGWTDDAYNTPPTRFHLRAQRFLERLVVTNAAAICVYGKWLGEKLAARYPEIESRITEIPNGFDPADIEGIEPAEKKTGTRRLVYSGSLFLHHRDVFKAFLTSLNRLPPADRQALEVIIVGQVYPEAREDIIEAGLESEVNLFGYTTHSTAISFLLSADASLLLVRKGDFASVTGKVFELLMTGRPIIAIAEPRGACARVLQIAGAADQLCSPDDQLAITAALSRLVTGKLKAPDARLLAQFSRIEQTEELARVLGKAADGVSSMTPRPERAIEKLKVS